MAEYRDIVVIGAGIAGMTAAIYAARAGKSVQVLECEGFGGQIASSPQVENYPGIASVSGAALSDAMYSQASALGVQFSFARAAGVQPQPDGAAAGSPYQHGCFRVKYPGDHLFCLTGGHRFIQSHDHAQIAPV